ncbi:MAG: DUF6249 domain-containing protein, partial [Gammaproteobacteria bacterium]|nr:DUF6249 domain-containing protein [Gammaproteobacteria bacterium]
MGDLGIGAGLAALAFWGFIATVMVAGMWYTIRERESQHETVRRLMESGQPLDEELMNKLLSSEEKRLDRDFLLTAYILFPTAVGLALFALILGIQYPAALTPM